MGNYYEYRKYNMEKKLLGFKYFWCEKKCFGFFSIIFVTFWIVCFWLVFGLELFFLRFIEVFFGDFSYIFLFFLRDF